MTMLFFNNLTFLKGNIILNKIKRINFQVHRKKMNKKLKILRSLIQIDNLNKNKKETKELRLIYLKILNCLIHLKKMA
jgi:flagellar biosynthesis regulator FlbT